MIYFLLVGVVVTQAVAYYTQKAYIAELEELLTEVNEKDHTHFGGCC